MNHDHVRQFLRSKNWLDTDDDSRFINNRHPYAILVSEDEGMITLREKTGNDNGQNGEQIFSFTTLEQLQTWFEDHIGE